MDFFFLFSCFMLHRRWRRTSIARVYESLTTTSARISPKRIGILFSKSSSFFSFHFKFSIHSWRVSLFCVIIIVWATAFVATFSVVLYIHFVLGCIWVRSSWRPLNSCKLNRIQSMLIRAEKGRAVYTPKFWHSFLGGSWSHYIRVAAAALFSW